MWVSRLIRIGLPTLSSGKDIAANVEFSFHAPNQFGEVAAHGEDAGQRPAAFCDHHAFRGQMFQQVQRLAPELGNVERFGHVFSVQLTCTISKFRVVLQETRGDRIPSNRGRNVQTDLIESTGR